MPVDYDSLGFWERYHDAKGRYRNRDIIMLPSYYYAEPASTPDTTLSIPGGE